MGRPLRGSGIRLTLPFVFRFLGLWLVVAILAVLVFGITSYLLLSDNSDGGGRWLAVVLGLQTVGVILAIGVLAVFTTHRLAGPLIALKRAFDEVKGGNLDASLRLRRSDLHLQELETAFNEMMEALRERIGRQAS